MSQTAAKKLMTFEEYLTYDDGTDTRYELVDGELVEMPPESQENNDITKYLLFELAKHIPLALIAFNTEIEVMGRRSAPLTAAARISPRPETAGWRGPAATSHPAAIGPWGQMSPSLTA